MTRRFLVLRQVKLHLLCATLLVFPQEFAHAGKLDRASDAAEGRDDDRDERGNSGRRAATNIEFEDDAEAELALALVYYVLLSPFSIPHHLAHKEGSPERVLSRRPYEAAGCGLYCSVPSPSDEDTQLPENAGSRAQNPRSWGEGRAADDESLQGSKRASFAFGIEGGIDPAPLPLVALDLRAMTSMGIGLSTRLAGFREQERGDVDLGLLGKSHLLYRFATTSHVQFRAGLGARYFATPRALRGGVDFLYGFDIQWEKPVFTNFEFGLGMVGRAFAPEVRGTLGVYVGKAQLYAGWDQNWIGGVPLGGAIIGFGGIF